MRFCILSMSASSDSVSRTCARTLETTWLADKHQVDFVDIRSLPPVWVDGRKLPELPAEYTALDSALRAADGVVLAHPIYCYTASSATKAITELMSGALAKMPVGILASAGSLRSHLAVGDLMLSMMFEQSTICFPKVMIAMRADLENGVPNLELDARLRAFGDEFPRFASALSTYRLPARAIAA